MDSCSGTRKTCFIEEDDDDLASLTDVEAGYSGKTPHPFFSRSICYSRSSSFRNLTSLSSSSSSVSSPRSMRFYDARFEDNQPHFLEACFLCKKPLGGNRDIFMYRGDTPFCSEECRQEQIEIDEAKENWNLSSSMKASRKTDQRKSSSPTKTQNYPFPTGTVAAA